MVTTIAMLAWLMALVFGWLYFAVGPAQRINIRWAPGITVVDRTRLEQALQLSAGIEQNPPTWVYILRDRSRDNIARILSHPLVEDTHHIDRQAFTVQLDEPDMAPWLRSLIETDRLPLLAFLLAVVGFVAFWTCRRDLRRAGQQVWMAVASAAIRVADRMNS